MKLVVVQLSDIHIKTSSDVILRRTKEIAIAIKNVAPTADAYLLAITGDVAYSGTKDQYAFAAQFVIALMDELKAIGKPVFEFVIPGNHDADFSQQLDTREALLQFVRKNLDKIDPSGEIVRQILSVQKNFFEFEALLIRTAERPTNERIAYSYNFVVAGHTVRARCFNTAWVSTNPESPGTLVFPCNLIAGDLEA